MNVLSLFDGMSCGQQALERAGIKVDNYYASEIDKYAIKVTQANYPNTIQLGSVVNVDGHSLPKIDLLIGGSPCQSFSFAGKRKGMSTKDEQEILTLDHYLRLKSEGYEFEGQSYLFWEYMRLLNELRTKNPNVFFFLENVEMGEKWEKVLSKAIGVNGIHINSSLVSAQNRKRIYWTNIGMRPSGLFGDLESIIQQPKDKGILLKDVLESRVDEKYFLSEKMLDYFKNRKDNFNGGKINIREENEKSTAILKSSASIDISDNFIVHNTMPRSGDPKKGGTGPLSRSDGKTYCLDTGNTNVVEVRDLKAIMLGRSESWGQPEKDDGKSYTLCMGQPNGIKSNSRIRRLTPIECERLQTVKDNYSAKGLENHFHFINFTGNENTEICQQSVKNKDVHNQFQAEKLNYATSIIIDYLEMVQLNYQDQLLTILKNAKWMVAKDNNNLQSKRVLCTIKGGKDMEFLKFPKELINRKLNVNFAIRKSEEAELSDCVQSIIKCGNFTETHYLQKKKDLMSVQEGIIETPMELNFIDELSKSNLEENLLKESKLYTISTLINSIITQAIYKFLPKKNTLLHISSSIKLQEDSLELELLYIKTESIVSMSDSVRYKMLGNGWTVDVIVHFFNYLKQDLYELHRN